jgi:hypothetical protein
MAFTFIGFNQQHLEPLGLHDPVNELPNARRFEDEPRVLESGQEGLQLLLHSEDLGARDLLAALIQHAYLIKIPMYVQSYIMHGLSLSVTLLQIQQGRRTPLIIPFFSLFYFRPEIMLRARVEILIKKGLGKWFAYISDILMIKGSSKRAWVKLVGTYQILSTMIIWKLPIKYRAGG